MICFVDALGSSYLMPCLAINPSQPQQVRDNHICTQIHVLQETYTDVASPNPKITSETLQKIGTRKLVSQVDLRNLNITEEELMARLTTFDVVRDAHLLALQKYKEGGHRMKLACNLTEALLDCDALNKYKVPLCYREIDDDLEVIYNEVENRLD